MKLAIAAIALATAAAPVLAASPFDGTWKADVASAQLSKKPDIYLLKDMSYTCSSCVPAFTVRADGQFHPIAGHAYTDMVAVKVIDGHTIEETDQLKAKVMSVTTSTVSADGKTLHFAWHDMSNPSGKPTSGEGMQTRVGAMAADAHPISGSWQMASISSISDDALTMMLMLDGQTFSLSSPTGYSYKAQLGGRMVPIVGDQAGAMAQVKRLGADTIEETDYQGGKPLSRFTMTLLPDGKTIKAVSANLKHGTSSTFMLHKL